jgi:hypothetical protein
MGFVGGLRGRRWGGRRWPWRCLRTGSPGLGRGLLITGLRLGGGEDFFGGGLAFVFLEKIIGKLFFGHQNIFLNK